jgi:hypothetical protein
MRQTFHLSCLAALALIVPRGAALAQHSDIEFFYSDGKIQIEFGSEGQVFEGEFPTSGLFEQFTTDPGFGSEAAEGLGIQPGNIIDYNILGPLRYHDGTDFAPVPTGAQIEIFDTPTGGLIVNDSIIGPISGSGAIGMADGSGDLHAHVDFELQPLSLDTPQFGAYGILMELFTDEPGIANSDPFYIVFNFGLDEATFEGAVGDFAHAVPEPSSLVLCALGSVLLVFSSKRMRRRASAG